MKFRRGFVANSSSASYYVTLDGEHEVINYLLIEACEWTLWHHDLENSLTHNILRLKKNINDIEAQKETYLVETIDVLKERLKKDEEALEFIRNPHRFNHPNYGEQLISICLRTYGIKRTDMYNGTIKLEAATIMHNNYSEGMPRILQEVVLCCSFNEYPIKATCEKKSD